MKINFKSVKTQDIEGKEQMLDISKDLGNTIYGETMDIGEVELARRIYLEGEIELSEGEVEIVKRFIEKFFKGFIKEGFYKIINPKK
jgi:hypothetical protein